MMIYKDLEIPYEVVVLLVKNDVWKKLNDGCEDISFKTIILGKQKATKAKLEKAKYFIGEANNTDQYKIKDEDIKIVTIKNSDFKITLIDDPDRRFCFNSYCVEIGIENPQLKPKYKLSTFMLDRCMTNLVCSCSYMTDHKLHGRYFYRNEQDFYQYKPEDYNLSENLYRIETLGTNKKTTNLQIGHKYILKDKTKIIYLGSLSKETRYKTDYSWKNECDHAYFPNKLSGITRYSNKNTYQMYLNLDRIYEYGYKVPEMSDVEDFIESSKGKSVCQFLIDWVHFYEANSPDKNLIDCISFRDSLPSGVDIGEYFDNFDSDDIRPMLNSLCFERVKTELSKSGKKNIDSIVPYVYSMTSEYLTQFDDTAKETLFNLLIKPALSEMFRKNSYRFRTEIIDKMKAENKDVVNLYNIARSVGSYYVEELGALVVNKDTIGNLIFKGSEDKLNTLIIECKKACLK